jgi:SAM-dependent methyltransferase
MDDQPQGDAALRRHGHSLALYKRSGAGADYWEGYWSSESIRARIEAARSGELGELESPLVRYLPRDQRILEAGCGNARLLTALTARGYAIEGVDFAATTVAGVKAVDASLNVRVGDVYALDVPDGSYGAYISIGVLEHRFEGCTAAIAEAYRVLRPGGVALISVPYLNHLRRRALRGLPEATASELPGGLRFYQDHLDIDDFAARLRDKGFFSYRLRKVVKRACERAPIAVRRGHSHMMMFICRR